MELRRKSSIRDMVTRLAHRRELLSVKCVEGLIAESGLTEVIATEFVAQWSDLVMSFVELNEAQLADKARLLGAWCAVQRIPFEEVIAQLHYYKRATMPILVREYQGLEGYLDAHLALDELLTWLMGKIPLGYFGLNHQNQRE